MPTRPTKPSAAASRAPYSSFVGVPKSIDAETGEARELSVDGEAMRAYHERLRQFLERAETFSRTQEIGYHRVTTDTPVEEFVLAQIRGRLLV